ncbi:MAG: glycosyltransferase family 2 protein [Actinobacteria bacterium]|nr:glycosyltransferase family 2 protein [Actinomycetota bacterium]
MKQRPSTLVVIPAYNEEAALPGVLAELRRTVPDEDVLVVDDGSTDATSAVARDAGVLVATLPFNLGIGGALRTGFRYAVRHGYPRVVQFDADGQHDAEAIERLYEALDDGADMVIGSRFRATERDYDVGFFRGGAMELLRIFIQLAVGRRFTDASSGFRAFGPRALQLFSHAYPAEYMDSVEAILLAIYAGLRVDEVPTPMRDRVAGRPSTRNLKLVYHYLRVLLVMFFTATLRRGLPSDREPEAQP